MRQRLGVPANVAPNTRRTQFINHANYKIIHLNLIDWANATKIHTPPSAKHYFPPLTSRRSAKTMSRPERARFRKALKTSHLSSSRMEMCCSCFMNTKYECLKCKIPICNQCSVFEENEEVDGWKAGSSVAYCEPCDIEVRRAQGITPEEQSIDSFRSKKRRYM